MKIKYIEQNGEFTTLSKTIKNILYAKKQPSVTDLPKVFSVILEGERGIGKTLMVAELARIFNTKCFKIDGSPGIDRSVIEGYWIMDENGESVFIAGELVKAMEYANSFGIAFICVNEINAIRPPEQISFNSLTDWQAALNLISKSGTEFHINEDSLLVFVGTMNRNVLGVNQLQEAFYDRFFLTFPLGFPTPEIEMQILESITGISHAISEVLVNVVQDWRKLYYVEKAVHNVCTTRILVNLCTMLRFADESIVDSLIDAAIVHKLGINDRQYEKIETFMLGKNVRQIIMQNLPKSKLTKTIKPKIREEGVDGEELIKKVRIGNTEKLFLRTLQTYDGLTLQQMMEHTDKLYSQTYSTLRRLRYKKLVIQMGQFWYISDGGKNFI